MFFFAGLWAEPSILSFSGRGREVAVGRTTGIFLSFGSDGIWILGVFIGSSLRCAFLVSFRPWDNRLQVEALPPPIVG